MKHKLFRFSSRTALITFEIVAALAGVMLLAGGLFLWRLTSGPVDMGFAKDYIEGALHDPVKGYAVTLDRVVLSWPELKGPLMLDLKGVSLIRDGQTVVSVDEAKLGLARAPLFAGRINPVSITLAGPVLHLVRTADNRIALSLENNTAEAVEDAPAQANPLADILDNLTRPADTVDKRSLLDHLQAIEIKKASMIMEDHVLGVTWYLRDLDLLFGRDREGLAIKAGARLPGGRNEAATVLAEAVYARATREFQASLYLQDFDPRALSGKFDRLSFLDAHEIYLNGTVSLTLDSSLAVQKGAVSLQADNGWLTLPDVYATPFAYQNIAFEASYDRAAGKAEITQASLLAQDVLIELSSAAIIEGAKVTAPVTLRIADLPQEKIALLWPDALKGRSVETWLTKNISVGRFHDVAAALDVVVTKDAQGSWKVDTGEVTGSFGIENMTIDYRAPLTPAAKTKGSGKIENDALSIAIESAEVGGLKVTKGTVVIDKLTSDEVGTAAIDLDFTAPLPAVFAYIESEPIGMKGEDLGLDVAKIKGDAAINVNVTFPTVKDLLEEQVKVKVAGTLTDVLLPDIVKTLDLTGGPLNLIVADGKVSLSGSGQLEGRFVTLTWEEFLESAGKPYSSKITAKLDADPGLRQALGIELHDWLEGVMPVDVTYTEFGGGKAQAQVDGDATALRLMVKPFAYEKPPGIEARIQCLAMLENGDLKEIRGLSVQAPDMKVSEGRFSFVQAGQETVLRSGSIPKVILGETDAALELEVGADESLKIGLKGAFLDARPFLVKRKDKTVPQNGPPVVATVEVGRMRTRDNRLIEKARVYLNLDRQGMPNQLELDAVAGNGALFLRLKPDASGRMMFRLEAADAGAALRAFEVYENIKGGKLILAGQSPDAARRRLVQGSAQLTDFEVIRAPVLAQLVGAIGLTGLPQLLSGEGLSFARLEANFAWAMRPQGDLYTIADGRTSGSSLGLTFDGTIDKSQNVIDVEGHVVPVSEINELISSIPVIGDVLSGGSGAIFAATYEITGPADKPKVSVNPLSVLTPGIIRQILFED